MLVAFSLFYVYVCMLCMFHVFFDELSFFYVIVAFSLFYVLFSQFNMV